MPVRILTPDDDGSGGPAGWGNVPTLGGDVSTSVPTGTTGTSATQDQQSAVATTASIAQSVFLPPAPVWTPALDPAGMMTPPWVTWFATLNRKLGGYTATPTDDAQILNFDDGGPRQYQNAAIQALQVDYPAPAAPQPGPTAEGLWEGVPVSGVHMNGDERIYGAKTWMGKVGFFGAAATTKPAANTAAAAAAPAGGVGTAAGGWDTAVNRDAAITTINNLRTRVGELETKLQALGLLP